MSGRTFGCAAAAALWFLLGASPAAAAGNMKIGAFHVFPALTVTETLDSNLFLSAEDEEEAWITEVSPELRLALPMQHFLLQVHGRIEWLMHQDFEDEDTTDYEAGGALGAEFPGGLSFTLADTYTKSRLTHTSEFVREDYTLNEANVRVGYDIRDAVRLEVEYFNYDFTYDETDDRDRTENVFGLTAFYRFLPKTSALVEASFADFAYDATDVHDNTAMQVRAGLTWEATGKSTGEFRVGYQWKDYQDASQEDGEYAVAALGLRHNFTRRTTAEVTLQRSTIETNFFENPHYVRTSGRLDLSQKFTAKLYGRVSLEYQSDDYPNAAVFEEESGTRDDTLVGAGIAAGFDIFRWLNLELRYDYNDRDSNFDVFDYTDRKVAFAARAEF